MISGLSPVFHRAKFLLNENSPTILTAMGVAGTVGTAVLTARASFQAAEIIRQETVSEREEWLVSGQDENIPPVRDLSKTQKVKLVWRNYVPPVALGIPTIACIVMANRISSKKIAALAIASGISERAFQEYKDKVIEKLGGRQDEKVRDEIAQDRVNNDSSSQQIILMGTDVLCYDMSSGRYFQSTVEEIKRAENRVNEECIHFMACSLSFFYDEINLSPTSYSDTVGWNLDNKCEVIFSTTISQDKRPCLTIDFKKQPITDYERKAWGG